jgi:large subunit ribosomal protein L4
MPTVQIVDQANSVVGELTLSDSVFERKVRPEILHQVVRAQLAAKRRGTVGVKNRANIRGGGRKPWRQKGTGRARAGSNRSPIWTGGAVAHGPQARDYRLKVNKKVKRLALKMALSAKLAEGKLLVVDSLSLDEIKTKGFKKIQHQLGLKKCLIVSEKEDRHLYFSARNVPGVTVLTWQGLNTFDVLNHDQLALESATVEKIEERLV